MYHSLILNTCKQPPCEQNQIPIRDKLQDILQCNRYIHQVKVTQSLTNIHMYLIELHILNLQLKYVRENSIDKSCISCDTQH